MNLAQVHVLTGDLQLLCGLHLAGIKLQHEYQLMTKTTPSVLHAAVSNTQPIHLLKIGRFGKHILLTFSTFSLILKVGYKTSIFVTRGECPAVVTDAEKIMELVLVGPKGYLSLYYLDAQRHGGVSGYVHGIIPSEFNDKGLDIFDTLCTPAVVCSEIMRHSLVGHDKTIKAMLLQGNIIPGLDRDIVDEALFLSGVHPATNTANELSSFKITSIVKYLRLLYTRLIECIRNEHGSDAKIPLTIVHSVFRRDGEPCPSCKTPIIKIKVDGTSSYVCPTCQPEIKNLLQ